MLHSAQKEAPQTASQPLIHFKHSVDEKKEHVILEFQGEFEHSHTENFSHLSLGELKEVRKGTYALQVSNHSLEGKSQNLAKPLLLTKKVVNGEGEKELQVVGVVREKILFSLRPRPMKIPKGGD